MMRVVINGNTHDVARRGLSYEQIVSLTSSPAETPWVKWFVPGTDEMGMLEPGDVILLRPRLSFEVETRRP